MKHFVHRPYVPGDTIAALATPPGEGGIAIIRISGKRSIEIAGKVFSGPVRNYKSHSVHFGIVTDEKGERIDEALLLLMLGPRSYTGEDTVELQCHGGLIASRRVLDTVLKAGARLASPGEFTLKAFMNGKLDLAQAEAVQQLISAKSEKAFEFASKHLEGIFSKKIQTLQQKVVSLVAVLEAWVDFPEEGIEFASFEEICASLQEIIHEMEALVSTFHDGQKLHHGVSLCIVGCPNAGKSSLMNALLGKDRAIVTPIAGTTRDLLEEDLSFNGLHFRLIDTAGIRNAKEMIEQEGIRRSHQAMESADIVLFVVDASKEFGQEELDLVAKVPQHKTVLVWNKMDLTQTPKRELRWPYTVFLSAKERTGLDSLQKTINHIVWSGRTPPKDEVVLSSARHFEALSRAKMCCEKVLEGLQRGNSPEFLSFDIRQALVELGTIIGTNISEDILSSIFSQFCIGK